MSTILYCALAIEAYLNHVGTHTMPHWPPLKKKLSPEEKINVLSAHLNIPVAWGGAPYQAIAQALSFRNLVVHAETETIELPASDDSAVETKWQAYCKPTIATRILRDTKRFMAEFQAPSSPGHVPSFLLAERVA